MPNHPELSTNETIAANDNAATVEVAEVEPAFNPTNYKALPEAFYCDNCDELHVDAGIRFSCRTYGREWGRAYMTDDAYFESEVDDSETQDTEDYEYECANCETPVDEGAFNDTMNSLADILDREENRIALSREEAHNRQPFTDNPRMYRRPQMFSSNRRQFHEESYAILRKAALLGEFDAFNFTSEGYRDYPGYDTSSSIEGNTTQVAPIPDISEEEPEDHQPIVNEQHSRWNRGINMPNHVTCPNENCGYAFVSDSDMTDHICPKCSEEFNVGDTDMAGIRFRANF